MIAAEDRLYLAELCLRRAGLKVDAEKSYLIESRLGPVARREGFLSPEVFIEALRQGAEERLQWAAVEAMALPETDFFRDRIVFQRIVEDVLPTLAATRDEAPVRVWSATCGTGQEVYSLAMLLAETPQLARRVELYASDLSERSLEKAQAGLFSQFEVQRGLPARLLVRHFEKQGEAFAISPRIRQMVRWRRANLVDELLRAGPFDLILCRNLLGQLSEAGRGRAQAALRGALAPGGRLVVGLKDEISGLAAISPEAGIYAAA